MIAKAGRRASRGRRSALLLASVPAIVLAPAAAAQDGSRAVVQPLPPPAARDLSGALQRLAANPRDFAALVDAGIASLALNDVDAAIGFFGRALELRAGDPRAESGLAAAYLRADRAVEALQLFAHAERNGGIPPEFAADRALAYDLVGDNASAQALYRSVLARGHDPEVARRLALSQAIAGDKAGFEASLLPQLQARDLAGFRVRAFGLAILGEEDEAVSIAKAVMPPQMAERIAPYLRYMPRLTRAQQAAAANLGNFPRAAQIGRDDPRLAQYAGSSAVPGVRRADARLTPSGEPLGPRQPVEDSRSQRRRPGRDSATVARNRSAREVPAAQIAQAERRRSSDPLARTDTSGPVVVRRDTSQPVQPQPAAAPPPPPPPTPSPPPDPRPATTIGSIELPPTQPAAAAAPGFDLARVGTAPPPSVVLPAPSAPATEPEEVSVADAFADFKLVSAEPPRPATGAVDITAIEVPREVEAAPPPPPPAAKPKPAKPAHPSRHWVQVATGKDLKALAFDWRRFGRKAPDLLAKRSAFTTPWGVSRRLLTGPFESDKAAQEFVNDLKAAGLDAFAFTSDEGQEIAPLK